MYEVTGQPVISCLGSGTTKSLAKIKRKAKEKEEICRMHEFHFLRSLSADGL